MSNNSGVYIIKCKDTKIKDFYIGSTKNFNIRNNQHRYNCSNNNCQKNLYGFIRNNGGYNNFLFIPILYINTTNRDELLKAEKKIYKLLKPTLNKNNICPTREEYLTYRRKRYKDKFYCECCNCEGLASHKARHEKSMKHYINFIFS